MISNGSGKATKVSKDDAAKIREIKMNLLLKELNAEGITVDKLRSLQLSKNEREIFFAYSNKHGIPPNDFLRYVLSAYGGHPKAESAKPQETDSPFAPAPGLKRGKEKKCRACKGVGYRTIETKDPSGYKRQSYGKCPDCGGTGKR